MKKYLKSHLEKRFPNLLDNSKNLTFLHMYPARQGAGCAHSIRNAWPEHTQLSNGMLTSPERPKWDPLFLITSGHSMWVVHTRPVTDWVNDVKWSIPAALTSWYCEGPRRRRSSLKRLFKVYFRFGGAWVLLFRMLLSNLFSNMLHYKQTLVFCFQTQKCPLFPSPLYNAFQPQTLFFYYPWCPV